MSSDPRVLLRLPEGMRETLRDPLGPVYPDVERALEAGGTPVIAVGDVVAASLVQAGRPPTVAIVDGRTKRQAVTDVVEPSLLDALDSLPTGRSVANPPGTLTEELLEAVASVLEELPPSRPADIRVIDVDGEEDLAALPAIAAAPDGATVLYGQPDEGVVSIVVDQPVREYVLGLLRRFEGDTVRLRRLLDVDPRLWRAADPSR